MDMVHFFLSGLKIIYNIVIEFMQFAVYRRGGGWRLVGPRTPVRQRLNRCLCLGDWCGCAGRDFRVAWYGADSRDTCASVLGRTRVWCDATGWLGADSPCRRHRSGTGSRRSHACQTRELQGSWSKECLWSWELEKAKSSYLKSLLNSMLIFRV